ncbi:hypothetical protein BH20ACT6_BH20ACT6_19060 [soil metagenome]
MSTPPRTAKDPRGFARVTVFGVLWSLALLALAVVAGHDALAYGKLISGTPWIDSALTSLDGTKPLFSWVVFAGLAVLVGLVLVYFALRPRPYLGAAVRAETGVFLLDRGLSRLAAAAAEDVDGVDAARASTSGRRVTVDVHGLSAERDSELEGRVRERVQSRLEPLEQPPQVRVRDQGRG